MVHEMRRDVELLIWLCDATPVYVDRVSGRNVLVTAKAIAQWTGRAAQTISDYRSGRINIPVEVWRLLLVHIDEPQIFMLLIGDRDDIEVVFHRRPGSEPTKEILLGAIEDQGRFHQTQHYLADILKDGRIDEADAQRIQAYSDAYAAHRFSEASLHRTIIRAFEKAASERSS